MAAVAVGIRGDDSVTLKVGGGGGRPAAAAAGAVQARRVARSAAAAVTSQALTAVEVSSCGSGTAVGSVGGMAAAAAAATAAAAAAMAVCGDDAGAQGVRSGRPRKNVQRQCTATAPCGRGGRGGGGGSGIPVVGGSGGGHVTTRRQANAFVAACVAEEGGAGSDYSDLDDFIVCQPGADYGELFRRRYGRRGAAGRGSGAGGDGETEGDGDVSDSGKEGGPQDDVEVDSSDSGEL